MEVYFYADEFFLINFLGDCWVYALIINTVRCTATYRTVIFCSLLESLLATLCIVLRIPWEVKCVCIHCLINPLGTTVLFYKDKFDKKIIAHIYLYIFVMLLGGCLQFFSFYIRISWWSFACILILSFLVIRFTFFKNRNQSFKEQVAARVKIYIDDTCIEEQGLIDTGNSLKEPISGRPVSIIEKTLVINLEKNISNRICYIPFNSIGKSGVLMGFRADKMEIFCGKNTYVENKPIIAVSENRMSVKDKYKIIINPLLIS